MIRNLILVAGDQLDHASAAFDDFDCEHNAVWMAEVDEEATHTWCHKLRIAIFLSAMRHFRDELKNANRRVEYHELHLHRSKDRGKTFGQSLSRDVERLKPERLIMVEPGDFRVLEQLQATSDLLGLVLEIRPDRHFASRSSN